MRAMPGVTAAARRQLGRDVGRWPAIGPCAADTAPVCCAGRGRTPCNRSRPDAASLIDRNNDSSIRLVGVGMPWADPVLTIDPVRTSTSIGRLARQSKYIDVPLSGG